MENKIKIRSDFAAITAVNRKLENFKNKATKAIKMANISMYFDNMNSPNKTKRHVKDSYGHGVQGVIIMDNIIISSIQLEPFPFNRNENKIICIHINVMMLKHYIKMDLPQMYSRVIDQEFSNGWQGNGARAYVYIYDQCEMYSEDGTSSFEKDALLLLEKIDNSYKLCYKKPSTPLSQNAGGCWYCENKSKMGDNIFCYGLKEYVYQDSLVPIDCPLLVDTQKENCEEE